jgi:hypothetical protein
MPQGLPKVAHKTNIPIRHNGFGKTLELDNFIKVKLGNLRRIRGFGTWDEVSHLRETVNDH